MPCVMVTRQQYEDLNEGRSLSKPDGALSQSRRRLSNVSSVHDLHMAVVANQLPMVIQILGCFEGDINGKVKGATALGVALFKQRKDIFMELLKFHKATGLIDLDLPSRDHLGRDEPPVVTAARLRFFTGVNMLVEAGADIDGVDIFGHTALWFAIHHRYVTASEQLILQGANVSKTDMYNFTPLYLTLNLQLEKSLIHLLLYSGSNVDSPNLHASLSANKNLLSLAVKYGSEDLTMLLLELGIGHQRHGLTVAQRLSRAGITSQKDEFSKTVWARCSNPLSLQGICRSAVRDHLSWTKNNMQQFTCSILELPLPKFVKRYLLLPQLHDNFKGLLKHTGVNSV